ncbi:heterokaryon incompatibility protein-domain-containing protein [Xylogone sp. PMI_703]|nr:heterokaryon incompatibility protein-domain-containing protein [Xylogone sp. PMI_703]
MESYWQNESHRRCRTCPPLNLNEIFDPSQFDGLPPLSSAGDTPWSKYIRKVHTFTTQAFDMNDDPCGFCYLVRKVAALAERCPIPSFSFPAIPHKNPSTPKPSDGDGFTLAATLSSFMFRFPGQTANYSPSTQQGLESSSEEVPVSVYLLVIKGRNTLERVAYESDLPWISNIALSVIVGIRTTVNNTGTYIVEAVDGEFNKGSLFRNLLVQTEKINFRLLKSWLAYCVDHHGKCRRTVSAPNPHMKLIDCESRTLVAAKLGMPYAALSYVWGPPGRAEEYTYPSLPLDLPPTILDSMTVTLSLSIRYLWVDRYCIWQKNDEANVHKAIQVEHMEQIYRSALVTLVAASGSDPQYGLPGVSPVRSRKRGQILGRAGPQILVSGPIHQHQTNAIRGSKWNTRAWTFQESALSSRMLMFTDYEASFHCFEAECFEHLTHAVSPETNSEIRRGMEQASSIQTRDGIHNLIYSYSKRQMTYSSDALNAFLGVLSAWSKANENCHHYWGVTVCFPQSPYDCTENDIIGALWKALCWVHTDGHFHKGSRRSDFPSWSWLGLEGGISSDKWWSPQEIETLDSRISISTPDGQKVDWSNFVLSGRLSMSQSKWAQCLYIDGWVFKVGPFKLRGDRKGQSYHLPDIDLQTRDVLPNNILEFMSDLGTDSPSSLLTAQFEAISPSLTSEVAIVFERDGDKVMRIGLLHLVVRISETDPKIVHQPYRCDLARVFNPKRETVCFH